MITAGVSCQMNCSWAALAGEAVFSDRGEIAGHAHLAMYFICIFVSYMDTNFLTFPLTWGEYPPPSTLSCPGFPFLSGKLLDPPISLLSPSPPPLCHTFHISENTNETLSRYRQNHCIVSKFSVLNLHQR